MKKSEILNKLEESKKALQTVHLDLIVNKGFSKRCVECIDIIECIKVIDHLIGDLIKRLDTNDSNIL